MALGLSVLFAHRFSQTSWDVFFTHPHPCCRQGTCVKAHFVNGEAPVEHSLIIFGASDHPAIQTVPVAPAAGNPSDVANGQSFVFIY